MSDERDRPDAAADGIEADDGGSRGQTALVTRPLRPTGKRSRQRAAAGDEDGDGVDVVSAAAELTESDLEAETAVERRAGKGKKAQKRVEGPSRNPIFLVYSYLKQVVTELRKVIWPNRKQMITYTSVVLVLLIFMTALVAGSDYGFAKLVLLVFGE